MKKYLSVLVVLALLAGFFYFHPGEGSGVAAGPESATNTDATASAAAALAIPVSDYTEIYDDPAGRFSFRYPEDFVVNYLPSQSGSEVFIVTDPAKHAGVQIIVSGYAGQGSLTTDYIQSQIPDLHVTPGASVVGGPSGAVTFTSDNADFDGHSYETWFVHGSLLYQVSTYDSGAEWEKGILATWQFK